MIQRSQTRGVSRSGGARVDLKFIRIPHVLTCPIETKTNRRNLPAYIYINFNYLSRENSEESLCKARCHQHLLLLPIHESSLTQKD